MQSHRTPALVQEVSGGAGSSSAIVHEDDLLPELDPTETAARDPPASGVKKTVLVDLMTAYSHLRWEMKRLLDLVPQLPEAVGSALPSTRPVRRIHKLDMRLDSETVARLVAEYEAGTSSTELEQDFNLSNASVMKLRREAGAKLRRRGLHDADVSEANSALPERPLAQAGWPPNGCRR